MKLVLCSLAVVFLVFAVSRFEQIQAVECDPKELAPCLDAISKGTPPPPECCEKAKEQEPCVCQYMKDPNFGKYFKGPNIDKFAKACGLPWPVVCP